MNSIWKNLHLFPPGARQGSVNPGSKQVIFNYTNKNIKNFFKNHNYPRKLWDLIVCRHIFLHIKLECAVCQRRSDPFYIVSYYIKWVNTSCTHSNYKNQMYKSKNSRNYTWTFDIWSFSDLFFLHIKLKCMVTIKLSDLIQAYNSMF